MPQMGVSVAEGTIVEWRKRPGDWIEADEPVCDVTTDKIDVEIPAPASGRMQEILVEVKGTGIGGRVRKKDVLAYIEGQEGAPEGRPEPLLHIESPYRPDEADAPQPSEAGTEAAPAAPAGAPPPGVGELVGPTRREPMSVMRRAIARHMTGSRRTAAHCSTIVEADFARVAARRGELRDAMKRRGVSLTYLAFVARATVEALQEHPRLNASVDGDELVYHD